jgi:hypothetical protein
VRVGDRVLVADAAGERSFSQVGGDKEEYNAGNYLCELGS